MHLKISPSDKKNINCSHVGMNLLTCDLVTFHSYASDTIHDHKKGLAHPMFFLLSHHGINLCGVQLYFAARFPTT